MRHNGEQGYTPLVTMSLVRHNGEQGYTPKNVSKQTLKYCDNAGCLFRRVAASRVSSDGIHWSRSSACNETLVGDKTRGQESFCTAPVCVLCDDLLCDRFKDLSRSAPGSSVLSALVMSLHASDS